MERYNDTYSDKHYSGFFIWRIEDMYFFADWKDYPCIKTAWASLIGTYLHL